jgi:hypothetical protein
MKLMFFPCCHWPQHFESELELIANAIERNDEIRVIKCHGHLPACFMGRKNSIVQCMTCQSMFHKGMKLAGVSKEHILKLPYCKNSIQNVPFAFQNMDDLLSYQYKGVELGMSAASTYTWLHHREHKFDPKADKGELRRDIMAGVMVYAGLQQIVIRFRPDKMVFFNGRFPIVRSMLRFCEQEKIEYQIHERCGDEKRYWLIDNSTPHTIDYCSKEIAKIWKDGSSDKIEKANQWFIDRRKGFQQGWYSYVQQQQTNLLPPEIYENKGKKIIAVYNTTIAEYFGVKEWDFGIYKDQNKGIERILSDFDNVQNVLFFIRIHPNLKNNDLNSQLVELHEINKRHKNMILIPPDSPVSSYALLDACDTVLVFGSTVGVEACYWGKPVILASRAYYESVHACYQPKSHEELVSMLKKDIDPLPKERSLPYAYWEISRGNEFKHFIPEGISGGKFNGVQIKAAIMLRIINKLLFNYKKLFSKKH